ncbi:Protein of unknown function [Weissella confusa LBAE C39-2]
MGYLM